MARKTNPQPVVESRSASSKVEADPVIEGGQREKRELTFKLEVREDGKSGKKKIVGYAAVFDKLSVDLGGFREHIRKGAFKKSIDRGDDVRALYNHDSNFVLGRVKSGTLKMEEDDTGLRVEIDPPDAQWARDLMSSIDRGDISQMSFGFVVKDERWYRDEDAEEDPKTRRELLEVDVFDVSPVTFPAYPDTEAALRNQSFSGVQVGMVAQILKRAESGKALDENDRTVLTAAIASFESILKRGSAQGGEPAGTEQPEGQTAENPNKSASEDPNAARKRELELLALK